MKPFGFTPLVFFALIFFAQACVPPAPTWYADADGDGYGNPLDSVVTETGEPAPDGYIADNTDCDDNNASINPGATEVADGIDNNCNGLVDEAGPEPTTWYRDADGDGFGNDNDTTSAVDQPSGYVAVGGDCSDVNAAVYPGAPEVSDGIDNDCDGDVDEDFNVWYHDADSDGFGNPDDTLVSVTQPANYVGDASDCDDTNANTYPGAEEIADGEDNDCDGAIDEGFSSWYFDGDGDGYGDAANSQLATTQPANYVANAEDCDDSNSNTFPGATELPDGEDNDCDGSIDEGVATWYGDSDGDGYGDPTVSQEATTQPSGYVGNNSDCDDSDSNTYPGAIELADGKDNDCDGAIDEDFSLWYYDGDGDGYGDPANSQLATTQPLNYVTNAGDCDDSNSSIFPGAPELPDGLDNDCDGSIDDGVSSWYRDADSDGYGDPYDSQQATTKPAGYVGNNNDCDDTDSNTHPGASELADAKDNDCDGEVDEGISTWYHDGDNDGFGDPYDSTQSPFPLPYHVANNGDCDDNNVLVYPGQSEIYGNGIDDNCNSQQDEGFTVYYHDGDNDGYGDPLDSFAATYVPTGYLTDATDCNDNNPSINPGVIEIYGNGIDDNCNGQENELFALYFRDADGDGYGDPGDSTYNVSQPVGYLVDSSDCNDASAAVNPAAIEVVNAIDDNCDGEIDEGAAVWYRDNDTDGYGNNYSTTLAIGQPYGYVGDNSDCNDDNSAVYPDAIEVYNSIDDDCDGLADEGIAILTFYYDADGDGYGDPSVTVQSDMAPGGYVSNYFDCDDSNSAVNPGVLEVPGNGLDDDCNAVTSDNVPASYCDYIEVQYDLNESFYVVTNTPSDLGDLPYQPIGPGTITIRYEDNGFGEPLDGGSAHVVQYEIIANFIYHAAVADGSGGYITTDLVSAVPDDRYAVTGALSNGSAQGVLNGNVVTFSGLMTNHRTVGELTCTSYGFLGGIVCDQAPLGPIDINEDVPLTTITLSDVSPNLTSNAMSVERVADGGHADVDQTLLGDVIGVTDTFTTLCPE